MAQEGALGRLRGNLSSFEDLSLIETDTFITETRLCVMDGGSTIITGVEHDLNKHDHLNAHLRISLPVRDWGQCQVKL